MTQLIFQVQGGYAYGEDGSLLDVEDQGAWFVTDSEVEAWEAAAGMARAGREVHLRNTRTHESWDLNRNLGIAADVRRAKLAADAIYG